jgi:hypothetical protein
MISFPRSSRLNASLDEPNEKIKTERRRDHTLADRRWPTSRPGRRRRTGGGVRRRPWRLPSPGKEGDRQRHSARARVRSWTAERGAEAPALLWKLEWNSIRFGSRVRAWVGDAMERIIFGRGIRSGRAALSWRLRAARRERGRANAERGVAEWVG